MDTFAAVADKYVEWKMTSWEEALTLANSMMENWIFRGQADAEWGLATSLERYPKAASRRDPFWTMRDAERQMLDNFRRRARLISHDLPAKMTPLDWLALLQHHGGATRLLDFTESFYVGTFFAVESGTRDAVLWCINRKYIGQSLLDRGGEFRSLCRDFEQLIVDVSSRRGNTDRATRRLCNALLRSNHEDWGVIPVTPYNMNERLSVQQGLFLFPLGLAREFEYHLCRTLGLPDAPLPPKAQRSFSDVKLLLRDKQPVLVKILIPAKLRLKILHDLRRMNITHASIYPGLDGLAQSLNYHASGYRAIDDLHENGEQ